MTGETAPAGTGRHDVYDGFVSYSHAADGLLAPRLQSALQRFAKPWWKRRAVRIFRDESSLSANPHLWSSITDALDTSGWFILLLSPDAASSEWVNQEIDYWTTHRDASRILPVVTDGTFDWTNGDVSGSAVPATLAGVFGEEPRWVDLRWAGDDRQLDLQDPRFADAVADIASAIRGVPKDELASEEVTQHRRTIRTAWTAGIMLAILTITAIGFGITSARNADEARENAQRADQKTVEAEANAAEAEAQAAEAERQRLAAEQATAEATTSAQLARSRELAAAAVGLTDTDPELAVLLGLEAVRTAPDTDAPPSEARIALRQAVQSSYLIDLIPYGDIDPQGLYADLSPEADRLVVSEVNAIQVIDVSTHETLWRRTSSSLAGPDGESWDGCTSEAYFSASGNEVTVTVIGPNGEGCPVSSSLANSSGVVVLDATSGATLRSFWLDECPEIISGPTSPNGSLLPVVVPADGNCDPVQGLDWTITLLDFDTLGLVRSIPVPDIGMVSWSGDSTLISIGAFFGWGAVVYDARTGETVNEFPDGRFFGFLSPDGSLVATSDINSRVFLFDVSSGQVVDRLTDLGDGPVDVAWSDDSRRLAAGGRGARTVIWDAVSGLVDTVIPNTGALVGNIRFDDTGDRLLHLGPSDITIWDVSGTVEGSTNTVDLDALIQANSVSAGPTVGAFLYVQDDWYVGTFDPVSGVLGEAMLAVDMGRRTAVLDDGRVVVFPRTGGPEEDALVTGPVVAWDPDTGAQEAFWGCAARRPDIERVPGTQRWEGTCIDGSEYFDLDRALMAPDRSLLAITSKSQELLLFDPNTLELLESMPLPDGALTIREFGGDWILTSDDWTGVTSPTRSLSLVGLSDMDHRATLPGQWAKSSRDGSLVAVGGWSGEITVLETSTGRVVQDLDGPTARIRGLAFSPDGAYLMTSATDGFLRVWDVTDGSELERIPLGSRSSGSGDGYWIDEDTIAVALGSGRWTTIDIGLESLLSLARSRLLRTFTSDECARYGIDPCPMLEELRGG